MESVNLKKTDIHPTAVVHPWARIGARVKIGPYSVIGPNVALGDGCVVGSNCLVDGVTTIGRDNRIFHGASVGTEPQDLKYKGEPSELRIGSDNVIREHVTMNPGTEGGGMVTASLSALCPSVCNGDLWRCVNAWRQSLSTYSGQYCILI